MQEQIINIPTRAGSVDTFICHPERRGPWPGVLFFMDAPGIREELYDMVRRIATVGYYVILPNLFYRYGHRTTCGPKATDESSEDFKRMIELMLSVTSSMVVEDTGALLDFLERQHPVKKGPLGCVGYCMGGGFAVTAAASYSERFGAAASFHGVPLVTAQPDSPHRVVGKIKAQAYFCFGELDRLVPEKDVDTFQAALENTLVRYELEVYEGVDHGFVFPQRAAYQKASAEKHWERLFELFRGNIG
jgi:carboxymethylenebutenolidase